MTNPHSTQETTGAAARHLTIRCQFCDSWNRIDASRIPDRPKCGNCGRPILLDRPILLGDSDFSRTITESEIPVLVDFYADWCGPCKMMAPAIDDLAARYQGRVLVVKVDTDRAPQTAATFNIRGIPSTIVFRNGQEVTRQTGAMPAAMLESLLAKSGVGAGA